MVCARNFLASTKECLRKLCLDPFFSIVVNDISSVDSSKSLVIKYADDITLNVPVVNNNDASTLEVKNIQQWAKNNSMNFKLNLKNTWKMVVKGRTT